MNNSEQSLCENSFVNTFRETVKKKYDQIYFGDDIVEKYGHMCSGIDSVAIHEDRIIIIKCKQSNEFDFIRGVFAIKKLEQKQCKLFLLCRKLKLNECGHASFNYGNSIVISEAEWTLHRENYDLEFYNLGEVSEPFSIVYKRHVKFVMG